MARLTDSQRRASRADQIADVVTRLAGWGSNREAIRPMVAVQIHILTGVGGQIAAKYEIEAIRRIVLQKHLTVKAGLLDLRATGLWDHRLLGGDHDIYGNAPQGGWNNCINRHSPDGRPVSASGAEDWHGWPPCPPTCRSFRADPARPASSKAVRAPVCAVGPIFGRTSPVSGIGVSVASGVNIARPVGSAGRGSCPGCAGTGRAARRPRPSGRPCIWRGR